MDESNCWVNKHLRWCASSVWCYVFTVYLNWKVHLSIESSLFFFIQNRTIKYLWLVLIAIDSRKTKHVHIVIIHFANEHTSYHRQYRWVFFMFIVALLSRQVIHTRISSIKRVLTVLHADFFLHSFIHSHTPSNQQQQHCESEEESSMKQTTFYLPIHLNVIETIFSLLIVTEIKWKNKNTQFYKVNEFENTLRNKRKQNNFVFDEKSTQENWFNAFIWNGKRTTTQKHITAHSVLCLSVCVCF